MSSSFDLPSEELRRLGYRAVDLLVAHMAALRDSPCRTPVPAQVQAELMWQPLPEEPSNPDALLDYVEQRILRYPMGNNSPRFFGWANSPAAPLAAVVEMLASGLNPSVAGGDHAATYVEHAVLAWMKTIMGLPPNAGGILTSGGSVANLIGLAVMRHVKTDGQVRMRGVDAGSRLMVYASTEGHSCLQKNVELLGLGSQSLRRLPVTADWTFDVAGLRTQIAADRRAGMAPACVAASAGTVNTGAVDPLDQLAQLCLDEGLWFHVDAAIGGPGLLLPELREIYRGLERADSLAVDPHKWMYIPVECGCALVRDRGAMRETFSLVPPYLRDDTALPWFSEFGIQQSRGFRALKLWFTLKHVGAEGYRRSIAHDLEVTRRLRAMLTEHDDLEVIAGGPLSITCFRYRPANRSMADADVDALNRRLLEQLQNDGHVFLTSTELAGRLALRACIINFRTTEADVRALVDSVRSAGERLSR